jgi:hypothetical protein
MEKQTLINAINSLSGVIDALTRAGLNKEGEEVAKKILLLIEQL